MLKAGQAIVINSQVGTVNRKASNLYFDGGDQLGSNYPVAVVRGAFPANPGSLLAGAVEVLSTDDWGTNYEAPVGNDVSYDTSAFEMVKLFIMSAEDNNQVTYQIGASPNRYNTVTLNKGKSIAIDVKQSWTVVGSKPLQVDLVTGDIGSNYEMRWYALLPTNAWAMNYMQAVGDSVGKTKVILYNPNPYDIVVSYDHFVTTTGKRQTTSLKTDYVTIKSKKNGLTNIIQTGSAAKIYSNDVFLALSWTDTEMTDGNGVTTNGQAYDWGYPVMPYNMLTPQVIIGLGYGCTYNQCSSSTNKIMSTVWVAPVQDADIYVDYNNDGVVDATYTVGYLRSVVLKDTSDNDMTGALIFATAKGSGPTGTPVNIAAAWGQNAQFVLLTADDQSHSLDLGTCVLPFPTIRVSKTITLAQDNDGDGVISPGDMVTYDIRVTNVGQVNIPSGAVSIVDDGLDSQLTYVPGSTVYNTGGGTNVNIPDDTTGATLFPIDEKGITNQGLLAKRGGQHEILFNCMVKPRSQINRDTLVNTGYAQLIGNPAKPFGVTVPLNIPQIVPTSKPTKAPTKAPTKKPTKPPTHRPTHAPTKLPTRKPTHGPTAKPTKAPTAGPTKQPTSSPTTSPTSPPRYGPIGPYTEGLCPVDSTRPFLTLKNAPTPVEHHEAGPGYHLPEP